MMKKIYGSEAIQMLPTENGIVFVAQQRELQDKAVVVYRMFDLETYTTSIITRGVYLFAKFGNHFDKFEKSPNEFLNCKTAVLSDNRLIMTEKYGDTSIVEPDGSVRRVSKILYRGEAPAALTVGEDGLWASFTDSNAVVRYSLFNLREEMRISAPGDILNGPKGIAETVGKLKVCLPESKRIVDLDYENYTVEEYMTFDEPVYEYIKINSNEIVRLKSGIYRL